MMMMQIGRIVSASFSSEMNVLSVFTEDNSVSSAGVRLLTVGISAFSWLLERFLNEMMALKQ